MRLFFALWPDEATQHQWFHASESFIKVLGGHNLPAGNLHLTLHFLGEVDGSRVNTLIRLAETAPAGVIDLRFDRVECWRNADLACLRPATEPPALTRLVTTLATGLSATGFEVDKRSFKPHVTIARKLRQHTPALPVWPALDWRAGTLALVRSRLTPTGSDYAPIARWPLADTAG